VRPSSSPADADVAEPLRDAPAWERRLRYALAALLTAYLAFAAYEGARRPTEVEGFRYDALLTAVQADEVVRVDDTRDDYVLWQRADGAVFAERGMHGIDVRATVEAQRAAHANPRVVRYEPIGAPPLERPEWQSWVEWVGVVALFAMLASAPATPRHATRWAWFWVGLTGVGGVAYLLLSGSRTRTSKQRPEAYWGAHGLLVAVGLAVSLAFAREVVRPDQPPRRHGPGTVELVQTGTSAR
jgi:hypothetical protein